MLDTVTVQEHATMPPSVQKFASKHKYGKKRKKPMLDNFKKRPAASQVIKDEPSTAPSDGIDGVDDERRLGLEESQRVSAPKTPAASVKIRLCGRLQIWS
ncbi:hypothetical protein HPB50_002148 [Hyalomma asiaticum]|uniref:Uncharacterized protein n=1 Tax=Hyalomma asiaticum TaxID=266040 RepID=A0ACB7RPC0_HYAAI|nr:hypothetical protein HPB50_002148 [Hyalomma asiaticum]